MRTRIISILIMLTILMTGCQAQVSNVAPEVTPTQAVTPTTIPAVTDSTSPTDLPTLTPTATPTEIPTPTEAPVPTLTAVPSPTPTTSPMPSPTDNPSPTDLPTATPTPSPTATPTSAPVPTFTPTPSPTPHAHTYEKVQTIEPSCFKTGSIVSVCSECGDEVTEEIPAFGQHSWDSGEITLEATCREIGIMCFRCEVCGRERDEAIPATDNHVWDEGFVFREARCSHEGIIRHNCIVCFLSSYDEMIPKTTEHDWDSGTVTVNPTKNSEGVYTYSCFECGATKSETIEPSTFDASDYGNPYYIRTSNSPDNYIEFSIKDDVLTVSGKLLKTGLESVWICCDDMGDPIPAASGELFSTVIPLYAVTGKAEVTVYTKTTADGGYYWNYVWQEIFVENKDGDYCFVKSMVLDHNIDKMSAWKKAENYLPKSISEELVQLSNEIVGNETDAYKKLYLLNCWVADNIYYDYDYFYSRDGISYTNAEDVYSQGRSVCAGYANLLQRLVQAQGIPCKQAYTYSAGVGTIGYFDESNFNVTNSNHAHVEAYVDGRWVIMDPTWDSRNTYENGEYNYKAPSIRFFDVTLDYLSFSHKIISR